MAAALLAAGASILIGAPAFAEQVNAGCVAGLGGNAKLTGTANYVTIDGYEHWQSAGFKAVNPYPGGANRVDLALRRAGQTLWSYSADNVVSGVPYSVPINVTIPAGDLDYLKFHAIFDVPLLPDPSCSAYAS